MFQTTRVKPFLIFCFVLLFAATLVSCTTQREIRILHMNDFHGFAAGISHTGLMRSREDLLTSLHVQKSFGLRNPPCSLLQGT